MTWLALALGLGSATALLPVSLPAPLLAFLFLSALILAWLRPALLPFGIALGVAAGFLLTSAWGRANELSCVWQIPDGASVQVQGHFQGPPRGGATPFVVVDGLPGGCRLRVRAIVREGVPVPPVGRTVAGTGRWLARASPRGTPPERAGVLIFHEVAAESGLVRAPWALRARGVVHRRIEALYPKRQALVEALVLARREGIDSEVRERWSRTGTAHLLAISGFHVGVIAGVLYLLARALGLGPGRAPLVAAIASWIYVLSIGAPVAAARAASILGALALGRLIGRRVSPIGALASTFIALLFLRPGAIGTVAFQLSFAGAAGLILLGPAIRGRLATGISPVLPGPIRSGIASGVAATVATLPLVAWHFGRVSLVGIPATLVAGPLLAAAIPGVFLSILLSFVSPVAAGFVAGGADLLLAAADAVIGVLARVPGASVWAPRWWIVAGVVGATASRVVIRALARPRPRIRRILVAGWILGALISWPVPALIGWGSAVELIFLDVGQGDAVAIRSPRGRWLLVDTGPRSPRYDAGARVVVPYLRGRGASSLEALVLTHPDLDHIGGAEAVFSNLEVRRVLDPAKPAGRSAYVAALERARDSGSVWLVARAGNRLSLDGVTLEVLHPGGEGAAVVGDEANDQSVVLLLRYGRFTALLTGDAPAAVERALVEAGRIPDLAVLKAGHHGSETSTSWELLESSLPELAVISAGARNRYGHPHAPVLSRLERAGARIVRTDRDGAVRVRAFDTGLFSVSLERREDIGPRRRNPTQ